MEIEDLANAIGNTTVEAIHAFQQASVAKNTTIGYASDWRAFTIWCEEQSMIALPAEPLTVAAYLTFHANLVDADGDYFYAVGTLKRWLAAINKAHELRSETKPGPHPEVATTISGISRKHARPIARKAPLLLADLKRVLGEIDLSSWPAGVIGHRDHAMLLMGFTGAYRRSELAGLQIGDIVFHIDDGLHVLLRSSKTDQEGRGLIKGLPYGSSPLSCPPCAFARWVRVLAASENDQATLKRTLETANTLKHVCRDPLPELLRLDANSAAFRPVMKNGRIMDRPITGAVVNSTVKSRAANAGLNSVTLGAHSLRAGFVTQAFRAGASHHEIMRQTGHKSVAVLETYSRENNPLLHNAVTGIGL
ncbi:site-specific integrase [Cryobacterium sp. Y29]|uniref:site-specific integrase n=1 Tax=Cryobacterium sp. Y29 TaxID=2048285 RepID=UPI000CE5346D|nr:tyrosine-type recombinase/integrase [Cryobacterium sp. Y29]